MNLFSFIWHFLRHYKGTVALYIFLAICAGFWGPFNSLIIRSIIDMLPSINAGNLSQLSVPAFLLILNFIVFDNITWRGIGMINYKYEPVIKSQIIKETLEKVLANSNQYFQESLSGRIANQITILAENIEIILHRIAPDFIRGASLLLIAFTMSYFVSPTFFFIQLIWFLSFSTVSLWMSKRLIALSDEQATSESLLSGQLVDTITNHLNVRIFSQNTFELSRIDRYLNVLKEAIRKKEGFTVFLCIIQGAMIAVMLALAIFFLIRFYGQGLVTIGDFALILGLCMEIGHMMWYTMFRVADFNQSYGKCKHSLSFLLKTPEIQDNKEAKTLVCTKGQIAFRNVRFHYRGGETLFQDKSVTIEPGQKVGLVGYSGGGKSTFVNLILRLYDVTDGAILIDGEPINEVTQDSLRKNIAMIPQDPSLFHRSLMENIRYGKTDALDEEVIEASKRAHAHEFILAMPEGYQSLVGERGVKLSGGQRQRIAIARAILKNAPILILDEATSQLDSVTEHLIQESLWDLMKNKTTIVIAHRLSTLLRMDRILVFNKGKIIEDGTHLELLLKGGLYKTLWDSQVGGFLGDSRTKEYL